MSQGDGVFSPGKQNYGPLELARRFAQDVCGFFFEARKRDVIVHDLSLHYHTGSALRH
jgi:hypothetical protein